MGVDQSQKNQNKQNISQKWIRSEWLRWQPVHNPIFELCESGTLKLN
jgi:hypothetical protein